MAGIVSADPPAMRARRPATTGNEDERVPAFEESPSHFCRFSKARIVAALLACAVPAALAAEPARPPAYRVDLVPPPEENDGSVQLLRSRDAAPWPVAVREHWESRVQEAWNGADGLGAIDRSIGAWLEYPLVNALPSGELVVPFVEGSQMPLRGRLVLPRGKAAPRVVVLVDVSESAGRRRAALPLPGTMRRPSIREAGLAGALKLIRALDEQARRARIGEDLPEIGIVAFGEATLPLLELHTESGRRAAEAALLALVSGASDEAGRTDLVCALWTGWDWLQRDERAVEVLVVTDGDLPFSGRFGACDRAGGGHPQAVARCEARRNRTHCPARHEFERTGGTSDLSQLFHFARSIGASAKLSPIYLGASRPPRFLRELARFRNQGRYGQPGEADVWSWADRALPKAAQRSEARLVRARNLSTEEHTENLLANNGVDFAGVLRLVPGMNEIEILAEDVEGERGRFKFRVFAATDPVLEFREHLLGQNEELEHRLGRLVDATREQLRREPSTRGLEITID